jgi:3-phenylpropionate/trans-cinnamate dioxygenase alpha subunit
LDDFYHGDLDTSVHGLRQVAQLESYKGFVFATLDPTAPGLSEYLGAAGRLGLDLLAEKGDDMVVVPGVQKFLIECNWKFAVDNLFDWYHPQITHVSALAPGVLPLPPRAGTDPTARGNIDTESVKTADGRDLRLPDDPLSRKVDHVVVLGEYGHAIGGPTATANREHQAIDERWRERPQAIEVLGPVGIDVGGHPNIFPTAWVTGTQLSLRIPRTPWWTAPPTRWSRP